MKPKKHPTPVSKDDAGAGCLSFFVEHMFPDRLLSLSSTIIEFKVLIRRKVRMYEL